MSPEVFVLSLAALFAALFAWGFRVLPNEGWQIIAAVPVSRDADGGWKGLNLTYYGFFNATACAFSVAIILLLMSAIGVALLSTLIIVGVLLAFSVPAAKFVARAVEGKRYTFTVGGASFVGALVLPCAIYFINIFLRKSETEIPALPLFAAAGIAYAFGEGLGRLACISFGCCYGKPLRESHPLLQRIFSRHCFVFTGNTKKVAYEGALVGSPVVPIQAVTAIVHAAAALAGTYFFFKSNWGTAFIVPVFVTQGWRVASEFFRADYRGGGRISAYQFMAAMSLIYSAAVVVFTPVPQVREPDVLAGMSSLASGWLVLLLQMLWVTIFLYTGRSMVTTARLSFHVVRQRT